jgi:hypothetical protein
MKRIDWPMVVAVLVLLISLFVMAMVARAEESICLSGSDAARAIVEVEEGRICKEVSAIQEQIIFEKDSQILQYDTVLNFCMEQGSRDAGTIDDLNEVIKDQKEAYNELMEAAKPSFADRVKTFMNDALLTIVIIGGIILLVQ